ncbi:hypothetical protein TSUD_256280 [Trifolium subterraneum]|uniref:Uncharacterized protein n=1 Tax=Trifolium subterraneum TaxID=3900 RepID=A0A2Z6MX69_TRISU|nr:hypothetical protein TSUD_256280 [Trifolium subterraneum]
MQHMVQQFGCMDKVVHQFGGMDKKTPHMVHLFGGMDMVVRHVALIVLVRPSSDNLHTP